MPTTRSRVKRLLAVCLPATALILGSAAYSQQAETADVPQRRQGASRAAADAKAAAGCRRMADSMRRSCCARP